MDEKDTAAPHEMLLDYRARVASGALTLNEAARALAARGPQSVFTEQDARGLLTRPLPEAVAQLRDILSRVEAQL
jgi:hypothetical protein